MQYPSSNLWLDVITSVEGVTIQASLLSTVLFCVAGLWISLGSAIMINIKFPNTLTLHKYLIFIVILGVTTFVPCKLIFQKLIISPNHIVQVSFSPFGFKTQSLDLMQIDKIYLEEGRWLVRRRSDKHLFTVRKNFLWYQVNDSITELARNRGIPILPSKVCPLIKLFGIPDYGEDDSWASVIDNSQ